MYDLMIKLDAWILQLLDNLKADFLLQLYIKYVPERAGIFAAVCLQVISFDRMYAAVVKSEKSIIKSVVIFKKVTHPRILFLCIFSVLKTTIGASSNYFRIVSQINRSQSKNPFFSLSPQSVA